MLYNVQRSTFPRFNVQRSHVQPSTFQRSTFNVQRSHGSTFNAPTVQRSHGSTFNLPTVQRSHISTFNLKPSTFQRSTFPHFNVQPATFNLPTFNVPTFQPSTCNLQPPPPLHRRHAPLSRVTVAVERRTRHQRVWSPRRSNDPFGIGTDQCIPSMRHCFDPLRLITQRDTRDAQPVRFFLYPARIG